MNAAGGFRAVYRDADTYEHLLLPHFFDGQTDEQLATGIIATHFGPAPDRRLRIVEFGCGTGRFTRGLEPHARELVCVDNSPSMIETVRGRFPSARTLCLDAGEAVTQLHDEAVAGSFDLAAAFWSLNYPLGEFFEHLSADGIQPTQYPATARAQAAQFVDRLLALVADGGHLLAFMFDPDTAEQRLVTALWERVAPFPPGGRGHTRELLLDRLREAEVAGRGALTHTRRPGAAVATSRQAALDWFTGVHLKDLPQLVGDPDVQQQIERFVDQHATPSGQVPIPTGVHVIDFQVAHEPGLRHLPDGWPG